jgi:hypothetical protein
LTDICPVCGKEETKVSTEAIIGDTTIQLDNFVVRTVSHLNCVFELKSELYELQTKSCKTCNLGGDCEEAVEMWIDPRHESHTALIPVTSCSLWEARLEK